MDLSDRVIVVTGASQGIGLAIAQACARAGASVACIARSVERVESVAQELGNGSRAYACHVQDTAEAQACTAKILEDFGRIDGLVNNAGITRDGLLMRMKPEAWNEVLAVNLTGTFNFTQPTVKAMIRRKFGRIVNITSVVGQMGNPGQANYAASKAGVIGFTKAMAREVAARNINVNAVAPGFIETAMTEALGDKARTDLQQTIPMQRFGQGGDVANVVVFLLSEASSYMTGQVLNCDGGMWMHS